MTISFGNVPLGSVLPIPFNTFGSSNESITLTGLAVTDIEVYKGTSVTQRASDAGYALIDTDGIDLDGTTGIHGFSIDTGDNTDAGFYTAGSFYYVVVSAVTVNAQTVNFVAATFRLVAAENTAGTPVADTVRVGGTAQTAGDLAALITTVDTVVDAILVDTGTTLDAKIDVIDSIVDAILLDTAELQTDWTNGGRLDLLLDAVKAKTDNLPADPADASDIAGAFSALDAKVDIIDANVDAILVDTGTTLDAKIDVIDTVVDAILADTGTDGVIIAAASRPGIRKNTALAGFEFLMTDDTNHEPAAGLTVTVTRSIDGGAFAGGTLSAVSEVSNGIYSVDFGAGDWNGNVVTLRATAPGADDLFITIKTSP